MGNARKRPKEMDFNGTEFENCPLKSPFDRNGSFQSRLARQRYSISHSDPGVELRLDPAFGNHSGNRSATGWMQTFLRQSFSSAHLLQSAALNVVRNVIWPRRHSLPLRLQPRVRKSVLGLAPIDTLFNPQQGRQPRDLRGYAPGLVL